jgi:hypothetical protein
MPRKKDPFRLERKDIREKPKEEKVVLYDDISRRHLNGAYVKSREHKSGFPAITVDCEDIHILTDCLSVEEYFRELKTFLEAFKEKTPSST